MLVVVLSVLLPLLSPGVVVLIVTLLVTLAGAPPLTVTLTVIAPLAPAARAPRFQRSVWPLTLDGAGVALTKVRARLAVYRPPARSPRWRCRCCGRPARRRTMRQPPRSPGRSYRSRPRAG